MEGNNTGFTFSEQLFAYVTQNTFKPFFHYSDSMNDYVERYTV